MLSILLKKNSKSIETPNAFTLPEINQFIPGAIVYTTFTLSGYGGGIPITCTYNNSDITSVEFSLDNLSWSSSLLSVPANTIIYVKIETKTLNFKQASWVVTAGYTGFTRQSTGILIPNPPDLAADNFTFAAITGAELNAYVITETLTVTGIEKNFSIVLSSNSSDCTIDAGTTTLSGSYSQTKIITTSGSGSFVIRCRALSSSAFNTQLSYSVTLNSNNNGSGSTSTSIFITSRNVKITPDQVGAIFTSITSSQNTTKTSNEVTLTGLEPNRQYTILTVDSTALVGYNGTFATSINVTTNSSGNFAYPVSMRWTSSSTLGIFTHNLYITTSGYGNSGFATWQVTVIDDVPSTITIPTSNNVELNTLIYSDTITVTGLQANINIPISVSGFGSPAVAFGTTSTGSYTTSGSVTTSGTGTFVFRLRATSPVTFSSTGINITVGSGTATWAIVTRGPKSGTVTFTNSVDVARNTTHTHATVTVSNLEPNASYTFSATNIVNSPTIDAGTTTLSGTFSSTKTITTSGTGTCVLAVRTLSSTGWYYTITNTVSSQYGSSPTYNTSIGSYSIRTIGPTYSGGTLSITNLTNQPISSTVTSGRGTISGLSPSVQFDFSGTENGAVIDTASTKGGAFSGTFATTKRATTYSDGTIDLQIRLNTGSSFSTAYLTQVRVTDVWYSGNSALQNGSFSATTAALDNSGACSGFTSVTGAAKSTVIESNVVTISGLQPNYTFTLVASANGGLRVGTSSITSAWSAVGGSRTVTTSSTGTCVAQLRVSSSASGNTTRSATLSLSGGTLTGTVTFSVTTGA